MFEAFRNRAATLLVLSCACLGGCASPVKPIPLAAVAPAAAPPVEVFSLDTPVHIIAANPSGMAVLQQDIPRLMASKSYLLVDDMSLSQIASVSGGRFTTAKLNQLELDLARLRTGELASN